MRLYNDVLIYNDLKVEFKLLCILMSRHVILCEIYDLIDEKIKKCKEPPLPSE